MEKPILFSGSMVRRILSGEKSQTRRVLEPIGIDGSTLRLDCVDGNRYYFKPKYQVGDLLWVKETLQFFGEPNGIASNMFEPLHYACDENPSGKVGLAIKNIPSDWRLPKHNGEKIPSLFMPRWASRITLRVTGVKVERLQDISEEDYKAEGILEVNNGFHWIPDDPNEQYATLRYKTAVGAFQGLWESINGPDSWKANPWVVVISFERITP